MSVKHCRLLSETFFLKQHLDFELSPGTKDRILLLPPVPAARAPRALGKGTAPVPGTELGSASPARPHDADIRWYSLLRLSSQAKTSLPYTTYIIYVAINCSVYLW